jgi:hypothetical protein
MGMVCITLHRECESILRIHILAWNACPGAYMSAYSTSYLIQLIRCTLLSKYLLDRRHVKGCARETSFLQPGKGEQGRN